MDKMEFIEIPLYGIYGEGKVTLVDGDYDGEYFGQFKWYVTPKGYVVRNDGVGKERKLVYLHHEVLPTVSAKAGHIVRDHIDGNKLNNRSCNLRLVSHSANMKNSPGRSTTSYKGVYYRLGRGGRVRTKPYQAFYRGVGVPVKHLGYFATPEEAALAYNKEALAHNDLFARLNSL